MEALTRFDLDTLCIIAEVAAALLLLSIAWRPRSKPATESPVVATFDGSAYENVFVQAVVATGRALGNRIEESDCNRLSQLQQQLPETWRDRLTGMLNASGMDRIICQWSTERTPSTPANGYALLSLRSYDTLMDEHGAMTAEMAIRSIGEILQKSLTQRAVVSRYQPNRFLIHHFGSNLTDSKRSLESILEQLVAPEFFSSHGNAIALECEVQYWGCVRSVTPDELLRLLEDGDDSDEGSVVPMSEPSAEATSHMESTEVTLPTQPEVAIEEQHQEAEHHQEELVVSPIDVEPEIDPPASSQPEPEKVADEAAADKGAGRALEGFATADDIASLFAELQGAEVSTTKVAMPPVPVVDESVHSVSTRSIYTDDIESTGIDDDLASLFATVRSSAQGSFAYQAEPTLRENSAATPVLSGHENATSVVPNAGKMGFSPGSDAIPLAKS